MTLSKFGMITKAAIAAALCMGSVPAMANPACALSVQGCVLPVAEPVAAPVQQDVVQDIAEPKSFPLLPLLGLALAAAAIYFFVLDTDNDTAPASP